MFIIKYDEEINDLMKSFGRKDYAKLQKKRITDKNGKSRMVWVKVDQVKTNNRRPAAQEMPEEKRNLRQ